MNETPRDLWSGLPSEGPPPKPLTYTERETLKLLWRFRDRPPGIAWLIGRGALTALILSPFMLIPAGGVAFVGTIAIRLIEGEGSDAEIMGAAIGFATWIGLTFGFVVRDQIEIGQAVASWPTMNRTLLFPAIERRLFGDPNTKNSDAKEVRA